MNLLLFPWRINRKKNQGRISSIFIREEGWEGSISIQSKGLGLYNNFFHIIRGGGNCPQTTPLRRIEWMPEKILLSDVIYICSFKQQNFTSLFLRGGRVVWHDIKVLNEQKVSCIREDCNTAQPLSLYAKVLPMLYWKQFLCNKCTQLIIAGEHRI